VDYSNKETMSAVTIEGLEGVVNEIKSLTNDRMKRLEIIKILRLQVKPILAAVKANTPVADEDIIFRKKVYQPENLKKSMAIKTSPSKRYPNVLIGPRKGSNKVNDGFYAFFIQYGYLWNYKIPENDFIGDAAGPLIGSVDSKMSFELEKYIYKKSDTLNL
jgi:hypothetical protein